MFYIECGNGTQLVGASPECLCKVEEGGKVTNHAIAGTVRRGKTPEGELPGSRERSLSLSLSTDSRSRALRSLPDPPFTPAAAEDAELAAQLAASVKDRAEHVMLVDLARNDINRVCRPETVVVDSLMQVEKFSHVMHLTSQVSGMLREDQDR